MLRKLVHRDETSTTSSWVPEAFLGLLRSAFPAMMPCFTQVPIYGANQPGTEASATKSQYKPSFKVVSLGDAGTTEVDFVCLSPSWEGPTLDTPERSPLGVSFNIKETSEKLQRQDVFSLSTTERRVKFKILGCRPRVNATKRNLRL